MTALSKDEVQRILDSSPLIRFLGVRVDTMDPAKGVITLTLPTRPEFERLPGTGQYHGGVLSAFIDIAGDFAVAMSVGGAVPTINLRVDYLRPASGPALQATATVRRLGRTIGVIDIDVTDTAGTVVAIGRGTYGTQTA